VVFVAAELLLLLVLLGVLVPFEPSEASLLSAGAGLLLLLPLLSSANDGLLLLLLLSVLAGTSVLTAAGGLLLLSVLAGLSLLSAAEEVLLLSAEARLSLLWSDGGLLLLLLLLSRDGRLLSSAVGRMLLPLEMYTALLVTVSWLQAASSTSARQFLGVHSLKFGKAAVTAGNGFTRLHSITVLCCRRMG
jgi:hypothetical protein